MTFPDPTIATACRDQRIAIVTHYNIGKKSPEIHRDLGYPERTIRGVTKRYKERGHINDALRSGRPPTLNTHDKKKLVEACEKEPAATFHTLSNLDNIHCSA